MRSQSGRGATGWLRAIPTSYRTKMRNLDYRIACQRWLHLPLPILMAGVRNEPEPPCHCWQRGTTEPAVADRRGDHDMVCRNCNKLWRHNGVVRGLEGAARLAGLHTSRVVLPFCRHPGDISKKQPDLLIEDFHSAGEPTLADVTVTDPTALSHFNTLYEIVGSIADLKEKSKNTKYREQAQTMGYCFRAFGIESWGAWGPQATAVLKQIIAHATNTGAANTAAVAGWGAPHIAEVARQWVSIELRTEEARMLRRAVATQNSVPVLYSCTDRFQNRKL